MKKKDKAREEGGGRNGRRGRRRRTGEMGTEGQWGSFEIRSRYKNFQTAPKHLVSFTQLAKRGRIQVQIMTLQFSNYCSLSKLIDFCSVSLSPTWDNNMQLRVQTTELTQLICSAQCRPFMLVIPLHPSYANSWKELPVTVRVSWALRQAQC